MSKKERYDNRLMQVLILLLSLTLLSLWMLTNLYAKYVSQGEGSDSARVAKFQINASDNFRETYELDPSMTDNDSQKVNVQITNDSEVATKYTFTFETDGNIPFDIEAKAPEGEQLTKQENEMKWTVQKPPTNSENENYTFTIKIKNTGEDNYQYAGGIGSIKMTVSADQID